jgi:hypothetical protein
MSKARLMQLRHERGRTREVNDIRELTSGKLSDFEYEIHWPLSVVPGDGTCKGHPSVSLLPLSSPALPLFICTFPIPLYHPQGPHSEADDSRIQSPMTSQKSTH